MSIFCLFVHLIFNVLLPPYVILPYVDVKSVGSFLCRTEQCIQFLHS